MQLLSARTSPRGNLNTFMTATEAYEAKVDPKFFNMPEGLSAVRKSSLQEKKDLRARNSVLIPENMDGMLLKAPSTDLLGAKRRSPSACSRRSSPESYRGAGTTSNNPFKKSISMCNREQKKILNEDISITDQKVQNENPLNSRNIKRIKTISPKDLLTQSGKQQLGGFESCEMRKWIKQAPKKIGRFVTKQQLYFIYKLIANRH